MCGSATLAIAVSSSSMKVASVTTTATIQGLIGGRSAAASGTEMEAAAGLMGAPACFDATRDRSVSYNFQWNTISDQLVAEPVLRGSNGQRRANPPGNHSRRNSVTSCPLAISTTLAMLMNRPCSTTPGISLSLRASADGARVWAKLQTQTWAPASATQA